MKLLVIIPAYNEEKSIERVINDLKTNCPEADYLIVNDCSKDHTEEICRKNEYNYVSLPINLGIGGGVQTGYRYAVAKNYDIAVQLDGDGQHDSRYIQNLIQPILDGKAEMTIGSRFIEKNGFQSSAARRVGIRFLKWLIYVCCGEKIRDTTSGFRACSRELIEFFSKSYAQDYPEPEAIISAILNRYRVREVPVTMNERQNGKSSINHLKSVYYMVKVSMAILIYRISFNGGKKK